MSRRSSIQLYTFLNICHPPSLESAVRFNSSKVDKTLIDIHFVLIKRRVGDGQVLAVLRITRVMTRASVFVLTLRVPCDRTAKMLTDRRQREDFTLVIPRDPSYQLRLAFVPTVYLMNLEFELLRFVRNLALFDNLYERAFSLLLKKR